MIINNIDINGITNNASSVIPKDMFVAVKGTVNNGENFIPEAIANGASAILKYSYQDEIKIENNILYISTPNVRKAQSQYAAQLFPEQPSTITAVTGTNGKTSVAEFMRQILRMHNINAASIGTLGVIQNTYIPTKCLTSPDSILLHKTLNELTSTGVTDLILEASSHALDQDRLSYVNIQTGIWTNLSQDHLDYHKTMDAYRLAKLRLTELVQENFIYNSDDEIVRTSIENASYKKKLFSFGKSGKDCQLLGIRHDDLQQIFDIKLFGKLYSVHSNITGEFQIYNLMAAMIGACLHDINPEQVIKYTSSITPPPGRLEKIFETKTHKRGFVDFAHTPDGLEKVLQTISDLPHNRLITVFGCGGDRDKNKRPLMGEVVGKFSNIAIVTNDNPRTEDPDAIISDILKCGYDLIIEKDRAKAIELGMTLMEDNDILLIAGKGHETFQTINNKECPFSDRETTKILSQKLFHVEL